MPFSSGEENFLQLNQDDFDFNIQFEQIFFAIIPSTLFILSSLWRTVSQARKPNIVDAPIFQLIKLVRGSPAAGTPLRTKNACEILILCIGDDYCIRRPRTVPPYPRCRRLIRRHQSLLGGLGLEACFGPIHGIT